MAYTSWQKFVTDEQGNILPNATVTVRDSATQQIASIASDDTGTSKTNPFLTIASGLALFYAEDGVYDVQVEFGGDTSTFEKQRLGSAQSRDVGTADDQVPTYAQVRDSIGSRLITTVSAASYTVTDADNGKWIKFTNSGVVNVTLALTESKFCFMQNQGTGSIVFSSASTIESVDGIVGITARYGYAVATGTDSGIALTVDDTASADPQIIDSDADLPPIDGGTGERIFTYPFYIIRGNINLGAGPIRGVAAAGLRFSGLSPDSSNLTYTGTGAMIRGADCAFYSSDVSFTTNGQLFDLTNPTVTTNPFIWEKSFFFGSTARSIGNANGFVYYLGDAVFATDIADGLTVQAPACLLVGLRSSEIRTATGATGKCIRLGTSVIQTSRLEGCIIDATSVGSTGIDRESATVVSASWTGNTFEGLGTRVAGVSHTFGNVWFSGNTGIQNSDVHGQASIVDNATATTIATADTPVKLTAATTGSQLERVTHSSNRLTWDHVDPGTAAVFVSVNVAKVGGGTQDYIIHVYKNGAALPTPIKRTAAGLTSAGRSYAMFGLIPMVQGDYIEVWGECVGGTVSLLAVDLTIQFI